MHLRNDAPSLFMLTTFAREMRKKPTRSESLLWAQLRGRKLGARFRRQAVLGRFIVDFYAPCHRLVVEVDGGVHEAQWRYDIARDAELERFHDARVVRVVAERGGCGRDCSAQAVSALLAEPSIATDTLRTIAILTTHLRERIPVWLALFWRTLRSGYAIAR
jgi:very-short-patch-repair endonuclease